MDTALVTGGAGFIGSHLACALVERGFKVKVLDDFSTGRTENLKCVEGTAEMINGSVADLLLVKKSMKGVDCVLHEAAIASVPRSIERPAESAMANIIGTLNVLIAARDARVKRVVYASSSSVYGDTPTLPKTEDMPPNPQSPYALTKYAGERYTQLFHSIYGLETLALRYFNVFGPRQDPNSQYAAVVPRFITSALSGKKQTIYGDGEQTRDFGYIKDVVEANMLAMNAKKGFGEVFNIAGGKRTSINELRSMICELAGKDVEAVYEPARKGDVKHSLADIGKAQRTLGFNPKYSVRDGLKETVEWYRGLR